MALVAQLTELQLLECSLLPDEFFAFALPLQLDADEWDALFRAFKDASLDAATDDLDRGQGKHPSSACRFRVGVHSSPVWFEVELPREYPVADDEPSVYVRGDGLNRAQQESWQRIVMDKMQDARKDDAGFVVQNLLTTYLLPLLRENMREDESLSVSFTPQQLTFKDTVTKPRQTFHTLLTSHHLISPSKRRNLQKWASELSLRGFAKVGYPGCIYCEGAKEDVLDFVARIKNLQWLALRVRFVEPLMLEQGGPDSASNACNQPSDLGLARWTEFEKVREVIECMRKAGREKYVTDVGFGVPTADSKS